MRKSPLLFLALLAGCSATPNHLGNPLLLPVQAVSAAWGNAGYARTRAKVEVFVKSNHPALLADLRAGGGPVLTQAYDVAGTPAALRAAHSAQMQKDLTLYQGNIDALITAIMVVSG